MKNLTEFSGVILRRAAQLRGQALADWKAQNPAPTADAAPEEEAERSEQSDAGSQATAQDATTSASEEAAPNSEEQAEAVTADANANTSPSSSDESENSADASEENSQESAAPSAPRMDDASLAAAIAEGLGLNEERAKYLMAALKAVGRKGLTQVRNVRVFEGEEGPPRSVKVDEWHFIIDKVATQKAKKSEGRDGVKGGKGKGRDGKGKGRGKPGRGRDDKKGNDSRRPSSGKGGRGFDGQSRDSRPGEIPSGGLGWSLSRDPNAPQEKRGRGKPGRKGPRRGKPGGRKGGPQVVHKAKTVE